MKEISPQYEISIYLNQLWKMMWRI